ncbi:SpoIID/LytB domain-containing protein [Oculatella sp. LEGE 06141]|uniref:SpoIID/LytB domain-containing protein n=1 Tax=Oculatella sp. LEGE 06141 TaxID=1828648 RepID=UPI00187EF71E|nr:SpoIID/LytB domain-containing protein [Oculatella sp. LEGE 06141]MBE9177027.1 SpoIID/LytB domain-containing protein [Oculatella sp. LEGE 06141]
MTSGLRPASQLLPWMKLARFGKKSWWAAMLLWFVAIAELTVGTAPARAQEELEMRVAVERGVEQVTVGSSTGAILRNESGQVLAELPAQKAFVLDADVGRVIVNTAQSQQPAGLVWLEPSDGGYVYIGDKWYRGRALVVPTGQEELTAVNYVDLEEYLYSVVGAEVPTSWPIEALKAQAVAARTYALHQRQTSANEVFDVGDTTSWQVYGGLSEEAVSTQMAVNATKGQVLTYSGRIIDAVFHACAGGHTENVEDVWRNPLPYLRGVPAYDADVPACQWSRNFTAAELSNNLPGLGNIIAIVPQSQTASGRIVRMEVRGDAGTRVMTGEEIRRALGLRSSKFRISAPRMAQIASTGGGPTVPTDFLFEGSGYGHGLGMSQWGAYTLALQGSTYQQILNHYYTGTALARIQIQ